MHKSCLRLNIGSDVAIWPTIYISVFKKIIFHTTALRHKGPYQTPFGKQKKNIILVVNERPT